MKEESIDLLCISAGMKIRITNLLTGKMKFSEAFLLKWDIFDLVLVEPNCVWEAVELHFAVVYLQFLSALKPVLASST